MELILHPETTRTIDTFLLQPSHALLITGGQGSGKGSVGLHIIGQLLKLVPTSVIDHPYVIHLDANLDGSIASIRSVQQFVKLKTPGQESLRRAIFIEHADKLSIEAQNAFLKLLEEPPTDTIIITTSDQPKQLLPTITSRVQQISVSSPSLEKLLEIYEARGHAKTEIQRAYYISEGSVGLMESLLNSSGEHPLTGQIETARSLLAANLFERLSRVDEISKQKESLPLLLQVLQRLCHAALVQAGHNNKAALVKRWHKSLQAVVNAEKQLSQNANSKLVITNLLLNL